MVEKNLLASAREESVRKSREWNLNIGGRSIGGGLVPIGDSVAKLNLWKKNGAEILYLTASRKSESVKKSLDALKKNGFPDGKLFSRGSRQSYASVAEEIAPDVIVEDDCESIGGEKEMVYPNMTPQSRSRIRSIVVKEFEGISHLPNDPKELMLT